MPGRPAARILDPVAHPIPGMLIPGPGSFNVIIGGKPAWRGVTAGAAAAIQAAKTTSDATIKAAEAATLAAAGSPGLPAAKAAEETVKATAAASMASMIAGAAGGADIHACLTPLPLPPHGPGVVIDGSTTVFINNLPACRQGDTIIEPVGPPDKIVLGLPTVLIGDAGGGAAAGAGAGAAASAAAGAGAGAAASAAAGAGAGAAAGAGAGPTRPTGTKGDTPGGRRTPVRKGANGPDDILENESADRLADAGFKVTQNPPAKPNGKKPDYHIEGEVADNIAPQQNTSAGNVVDRAARKVGEEQADRVVVNMKRSDLKPEDLKKAFNERFNTPDDSIRDLKEVFVIGKDGSIQQWLPPFN
jgi:uncharacterized Zn-binding protein involved in type VI secretion